MIYGTTLPALTAVYSGFVNGDTAAALASPVTLSTTANASSPVGTYPITISGGSSPNYAVILSPGVLVITPAALSVIITADAKTKVYGAPLPPLTASYTGFKNGDTAASLTERVTLTTTATASSPVGVYPIKVSGGASPDYTVGPARRHPHDYQSAAHDFRR